LYKAGVEWGGICFALYSAVCFAFSFVLPAMARKMGRRYTHTLCLVCGAVGLMSVVVIHDKYVLLLTMVGVGIAWASTLSMPYAILAASLPPERTGVYMGIFNFFIVTPEILASLFFGWLMIHLLGNNRIYAIIAGGVFMLVAAAMMQRVKDPRTLSVQDV
jgi:maltose/moltooligosaccharide transporter